MGSEHPSRLRLVALLGELQAHTIHAMSFIRRRRITFSLEHMSQMPSAIAAHNLRSFHPKRPIYMPRHCARHSVKESRPAAAGLEFLVGGIERSTAGGAGVDAGGRVVFVVVA